MGQEISTEGEGQPELDARRPTGLEIPGYFFGEPIGPDRDPNPEWVSEPSLQTGQGPRAVTSVSDSAQSRLLRPAPLKAIRLTRDARQYPDAERDRVFPPPKRWIYHEGKDFDWQGSQRVAVEKAEHDLLQGRIYWPQTYVTADANRWRYETEARAREYAENIRSKEATDDDNMDHEGLNAGYEYDEHESEEDDYAVDDGAEANAFLPATPIAANNFATLGLPTPASTSHLSSPQTSGNPSPLMGPSPLANLGDSSGDEQLSLVDLPHQREHSPVFASSSEDSDGQEKIESPCPSRSPRGPNDVPGRPLPVRNFTARRRSLSVQPSEHEHAVAHGDDVEDSDHGEYAIATYEDEDNMRGAVKQEDSPKKRRRVVREVPHPSPSQLSGTTAVEASQGHGSSRTPLSTRFTAAELRRMEIVVYDFARRTNMTNAEVHRLIQLRSRDADAMGVGCRCK